MRQAIAQWIYEQSVRSELNALKQAEKLPVEEVEQWQKERLRTLLQYSARHVPYYRDALSGKEALIRDNPTQALQTLPTLTKEILREEKEWLQTTEERNGQYWNTSGGSTGEPAQFLHDQAYLRWNRATKVFFDGWTGYAPGQPKVILWGASQDISSAAHWKRQVKDWLLDRHLLDSFEMDEESMRQYLRILNQVQPSQLQTYAQSGATLARFAKQEAINVSGIDAVLSSAGRLLPEMRTVMQEAFRAPVFDRYGSREVGDMACECSEHDGLHVNPLTHYIELLDADGNATDPGELGQVVVTLLTNYSMPLFRYRIGDTSSWAEGRCRCGRDWPRLEKIHGRVTDHFVTADGGIVHGEYFTHLLYGEEDIKQFQWVQEEQRHIRLRVVLRGLVERSDWIGREREELKREVKDVMGADCTFEVEVVDEIPVPPSGKHRYTISKVADEHL